MFKIIKVSLQPQDRGPGVLWQREPRQSQRARGSVWSDWEHLTETRIGERSCNSSGASQWQQCDSPRKKGGQLVEVTILTQTLPSSNTFYNFFLKAHSSLLVGWPSLFSKPVGCTGVTLPGEERLVKECMCMCVCACAHVHVCVCVPGCVWVCMCVHMHVYSMHVCTCLCVCAHVHQHLGYILGEHWKTTKQNVSKIHCSFYLIPK